VIKVPALSWTVQPVSTGTHAVVKTAPRSVLKLAVF
jgi:hypothetical protein